MNVRDLIHELEQFNPGLPVRVSTNNMDKGNSFALSWVLEMIETDDGDVHENNDDIKNTMDEPTWIEIGGRC